LNADIPLFSGYKRETFNFLGELSENNTLQWFADNRERYDNYIVLPSKSLILGLAPFFNQLVPEINTEPKFDRTLLRINKDARFSNGVPYRTYFLIHFKRFKNDSEFYIYLNSDGVELGLYINNTLGNELYFNKNLPGYKKELINTFKRFDLNGKFGFYKFNKEPELISEYFDIEKDFDTMARTKSILLQTELSKEEEVIYSSEFIIEVIKAFSRLYPVYSFAISPNPLALIETFEEQIGIVK
jgi:hypothetical protein